MKVSNEKIRSVPTNIISGFLGAGKTTAIMHLLQQKPSNERWAILVNEFGEIGIDGSLFNALLKETNNIFIKEVPGGCMCCASSLPMQVALNQLLKEAKPHRLLIEPTGLGHPIEVLQLLSNDYYQTALSLEKTLTLVDARHLDDCRYTEHATFNQQLEVADIIIGNKADLYDSHDKESLSHYISDHGYNAEQINFVEHAKIKFEWLAGKTNYQAKTKYQYRALAKYGVNALLQPPRAGLKQAKKTEEGYHSIGWSFAPSRVFNRANLLAFLQDIVAIRVKAIFITDKGIYSYNNTADGIHEEKIDDYNESRIELICETINDTWEQRLLQATC